jgi:hypothetical protein
MNKQSLLSMKTLSRFFYFTLLLFLLLIGYILSLIFQNCFIFFLPFLYISFCLDTFLRYSHISHYHIPVSIFLLYFFSSFQVICPGNEKFLRILLSFCSIVPKSFRWTTKISALTNNIYDNRNEHVGRIVGAESTIS